MTGQPFPTVHIADLPSQPAATSWLVSSLWAEAGVGVLGGHPKSCKTWMALDLALSVASGTPALGCFPVPRPGTVLVHLAEDSLASARARVAGLAERRGLDLRRVDLHLFDLSDMRLDLATELDRLARTVEKHEPRLLVLDPLVRLHRLNENDAADMSRLLSDLRSLQRRFGVAILLVHHARKNGGGRPGQSLRGSSDLWAWGDSNAYLARDGELLELTVEHRQHPAPQPLHLRLESDDGRRPAHLVVAEAPEVVRATDLADRVVAHVRANGPITRTQLRTELAVNNQRLGGTLDHLAGLGLLHRQPDGWVVSCDRSVPIPAHVPERNGLVDPPSCA